MFGSQRLTGTSTLPAQRPGSQHPGAQCPVPRGPASTQGLLRDHIYSAMTFNKAALAAAALTCSIVLFNTFTVSSICQDPVWKQEPRDLDVVELWSGPHGALVVAAHAMGLAAEAFDTCRIPGITNKPVPAEKTPI